MDKRLLDYIQELYNFCAIAAAVAVVLSKDKEKTIEDHLQTLQGILLAKTAAQDCLSNKTAGANQVPPFLSTLLQDDIQEVTIDSGYGSQDVEYVSSQQGHEQSATSLHQEVAVSQSQQCSQTAVDTTESSEVPKTVCNSQNFEIVLFSDMLGGITINDKPQRGTNTDNGNMIKSNDNQQSTRDSAVENARFIYALIGLRFAARKDDFIPVSTVSHYLSMASPDVTEHLNSSLLGDANTRVAADSNIASVFIQYHTQNTHQHLLQCVDRAMAALGKLMLDKRPYVVNECFNTWENSPEHYVVDNVCTALDFLCDEGDDSADYISSCINLVKSLLENIMEAENDEFVMWEQQCGMLLQLVGHRQLCGRVLSLLIENIEQLADDVKLNAKLVTAEQVKNMYRLASVQTRSFYIFNLTEDLLQEYKKIHGDIVSKCREAEISQEFQQGVTSVDGLWRSAFSCENNNHAKLRNSQQLISIWKASLTQSAMTFTNYNAHLLSVYTWSCIDLVKDLHE